MFNRISKLKEEKRYVEQLLVGAKKDYDSLNEVCVSLRVQIDTKKKVRFSDKDDVVTIPIIPTNTNTNSNTNTNTNTNTYHQKKKELDDSKVTISQN